MSESWQLLDEEIPGGGDYDLDKNHNAAPESPQVADCFPPWSRLRQFVRSMNR